MRKINCTVIVGLLGGLLICDKAIKSDHKRMKKETERLDDYYHLLVQWMRNKHYGWRISDYFEKNEYKKVAIYGMGEIGDLLYEDLKEAGIRVDYSIDQAGGSHFRELHGYTLEDDLPEVDVIIITPIFALDAITNKLKKVTNAKLVSIKDVIYD